MMYVCAFGDICVSSLSQCGPRRRPIAMVPQTLWSCWWLNIETVEEFEIVFDSYNIFRDETVVIEQHGVLE